MIIEEKKKLVPQLPKEVTTKIVMEGKVTFVDYGYGIDGMEFGRVITMFYQRKIRITIEDVEDNENH